MQPGYSFIHEGGGCFTAHDMRRYLTPFRRMPFMVFVVLLSCFLQLNLQTTLYAREDNARLLLKKTARGVKNRVYVVKKGEWIARILRSRFGKEQIPYALIRRLNPEIRDLNRIYPGQRIVFPAAEDAEPSKRESGEQGKSGSQVFDYKVREGDSISRIILFELKVEPAEALPAYRIIRRLNPEIDDMVHLQAGSTLRLPGQPPQTATGQQGVPDEAGTSGMVHSPSAERLLGIIRPVVERMRGTVAATGNYYIPLQETTQITIDCSQIPVVELDDGTTVLLDYGSRLSENMKGMIRQFWKNYGFLAAEELKDGFDALQKIFGYSRNYRMVRTDKPFMVAASPEVLVFPDWIISGKETRNGIVPREGLFLLSKDERPLPSEARIFLEKNGFIATEIVETRTLPIVEPPAAASASAITDMRKLKGIALAEKLLAMLGETPVKNAEAVVLNQARDGFNLSVIADLTIRRGEKRFILHSKTLPEQFKRILKESGTEVISIGENERGRPLIERVVRGLGFPVSYGFFAFRIPEEGGRTRLTTSFYALKATVGGDHIYMVDFEMSPGVPPLLEGGHGMRIVLY